MAFPGGKLRFGVMCAGLRLRAWQAACLKELLRVDGVEPAALLIDSARAESEAKSAEQPPRTLFSAIGRVLNGKTPLWGVYANRFYAGCAGSWRPEDLSGLLRQVPQINCGTIRKGNHSHYFTEADIERIQGLDLDFILRFGFGIIRGDILKAARHGVWSFHHGDMARYRGGPPAFWEMYHGDKVAGVTLQRLTNKLDAGVTLKQRFFAVFPESYHQTRETMYWGSVDLPACVCRDIRYGDASYLDAGPLEGAAPLFRSPSNRKFLRVVGRMLISRIRQKASWLFKRGQWGIGLSGKPIHTFLESGQLDGTRWLPYPRRSLFLADPFGVRRGDQLIVLAEEFNYKQRQGIISAIRVSENGSYSDPIPAIKDTRHFSYPYLLEHNNEIYCIPENRESGTITLYRAVNFPHQWESVAVLLEGVEASDPTVFQHEGRWWLLFVTGKRDSGQLLHAYHAEQIQGPWVPHTCNPLKGDVRSTRPAGTPFVHQGRLYRPAQDGSGTYGAAVVINEVTRLTPNTFAEHPVVRIGPARGGPYPAGLHTLAAVGDMTLVDGRRDIYSLSAFLQGLATLFRQRLGRRAASN